MIKPLFLFFQIFLVLKASQIESKNLDSIYTKAYKEKSKPDISQKENSKYFIQSTSDIHKLIPSLRIYPQGSDTFPMVSFRGISSPDYYSSILGVYIDGIPQAPNFLIQNLSDVQSINIISSLANLPYSENAPLGIIDIKMRNPMDKDYIFSEATISRLQEKVALNAGGELIDNRLWGKINMQYIYDNGYIRHPGNNRLLNNANALILGGSLYAQILDSMILTLHYDYQLLNSHKDFYLTRKQAISLRLESQKLASWYDFQNGEQDKILNLNPYNYAQTHNASIKLEHTIKNFDLNLVAAIQRATSLANEYPGIYVQDENTQGYYYNTTQMVFETRLEGYHDNFKSTFGVFYKYLLLDNGMDGVDTSALGYSGVWDAKERVHSLSFLGALKYQKKDFNINLGARYQLSYNHIESKNPPVTQISPYSNAEAFYTFNPFLLLSYDFKEARTYLQASSSKKPGGFAKFPFADTDTIPYFEESIYNIELGLQTYFAQKMGLFKAALYGIWRDNVQSYVGVGYYKSIKNIGSAYAYGLDTSFNLNWKIFNIFIHANLNASAFNHGGKNIGSIRILGEVGSYNLSGLTPKFAPIFSLNTGLDIAILKKQKHNLTLSFLLNTQSSYFLDDFNHEESLIQKAYATLDASLNYSFLEHYELILYTQNLTNARIFTTAIWDTQGRAYITNAPFNIGLQFIYHY